MSAFGPKRTLASAPHMSALRVKRTCRFTAQLSLLTQNGRSFCTAKCPLGCARTLRRMTVQLAAVLSGREIEPASAGAKEAALVGKAEQVRRLGKGQLQSAQILLGQLAARIVHQLDERCPFLFKAALQRTFAHAQFAGDFVSSRLSIGQAPDDHFARPVTYLSMVELLEILAGTALVQLSQRWIRRWKPCDHVVGSKQQTVAWRVKQHRTAESGTIGGQISRRRVGQFDCKRIDVAAANPAAETGQCNNNKLDALPWDRSIAAEEHERHPISRLLRSEERRVGKECRAR